MNDTATRPTPPALAAPKLPDASSRRVATPTWFDGTTTVTGASGSVALAATMCVRKPSTAARPYGTHSTRRPITSIVRTSGRAQGRYRHGADVEPGPCDDVPAKVNDESCATVNDTADNLLILDSSRRNARVNSEER